MIGHCVKLAGVGLDICECAGKVYRESHPEDRCHHTVVWQRSFSGDVMNFSWKPVHPNCSFWGQLGKFAQSTGIKVVPWQIYVWSFCFFGCMWCCQSIWVEPWKGAKYFSWGTKNWFFGGIMQNFGPKLCQFCVHFANFKDHISPVKRKSLGNHIRHALSAQNCHALWHTELPSLPASQLLIC